MGRNHVSAEFNLSQNRDCSRSLNLSFRCGSSTLLYTVHILYLSNWVGHLLNVLYLLFLCFSWRCFRRQIFAVAQNWSSFFAVGFAVGTKIFFSLCCCYSSASFFKETVSWYGIFYMSHAAQVLKKVFNGISILFLGICYVDRLSLDDEINGLKLLYISFRAGGFLNVFSWRSLLFTWSNHDYRTIEGPFFRTSKEFQANTCSWLFQQPCFKTCYPSAYVRYRKNCF